MPRKSGLRKPRRVFRKRRGVRKAARRVRVGRRAGVAEYASCSERVDIVPQGGGNFATNQMYNMVNTNLAQFQRASAIAANYQFFKIKQIKLTLKYAYDTFQGGVGLSSRPNLYYMLDKSGSVPLNPTLAMLKAMGARPHAFDNRQFTITWTPSVLNEVLGAGGAAQGAQYKISPWLSTNNNVVAPGVWNPSTVPHLGLYWYGEQLFVGGVQFNAEMEVQFIFKKPLIKLLPAAAPPVGIQIAEKDTSSDGIVGGPDSNPPVGA